MFFNILFLFAILASGSESVNQSCIYTFHVPKNELGESCTKAIGNGNIDNFKTRIALLEQIVNTQQKEIALSGENINSLRQQLTLLSATMTKYLTGEVSIPDNVPDLNNTSSSSNKRVGVNYIRYGHKGCPGSAKSIYDGFVGKSGYHLQSNPGGGVNYLCLPRKPEWLTGSQAGYQSQSYIYGVEYEKYNSPLIPTSVHNNDVPCAVCEVMGKSQKIMIPAKKSCPADWKKEYEGLLMAEHYTHTKSDFICVDSALQAVNGGSESKNGGHVYVVEAVCGSLPCPPYVDGYELACVVCTK